MQTSRSVFLSLLGDRPGQFHQFRHFKANFFFDNFCQRNIGGAHIADLSDQGSSERARCRIKLADAPREQINQNVGVSNLLQCLFSEFSVQSVSNYASRSM